MISFLKLAGTAVHVATKLFYVEDKSILKWFNTQFDVIHHVLGTFHCNVQW